MPQGEPPRSALHTNEAGRAIIKESEGLHLKAYRDGGQWLIGYGHADGAAPGKMITAAEAEAYLRADLALCETKVRDALTRPASSNAFSAMVSLCYNIGWQPFTASSLVRHFNAGKPDRAADAFLQWTKATVGGVRTVQPRLEARRRRERALFLTPDASS
jgi:lysozyme